MASSRAGKASSRSLWAFSAMALHFTSSAPIFSLWALTAYTQTEEWCTQYEYLRRDKHIAAPSHVKNVFTLSPETYCRYTNTIYLHLLPFSSRSSVRPCPLMYSPDASLRICSVTYVHHLMKMNNKQLTHVWDTWHCWRHPLTTDCLAITLPIIQQSVSITVI